MVKVNIYEQINCVCVTEEGGKGEFPNSIDGRMIPLLAPFRTDGRCVITFPCSQAIREIVECVVLAFSARTGFFCSFSDVTN